MNQQQNNLNTSSLSKKESNKLVLQRRHAFMHSAKQIGRELTNTCIKLEKLTECINMTFIFISNNKIYRHKSYLYQPNNKITIKNTLYL